MGTYQFSFWIKKISRLIKYMLKTEKKLSEDEALVKILWFAMPTWYNDMAAYARFDYFNESF